MLHIAQTLAEYDHDYEISMVAYDRFAFRRFEEDVEALGLKIEFVEHPQGGLKKGKATEAMKEAAKSRSATQKGCGCQVRCGCLKRQCLKGALG
jgi:phage terminase large subunit-like protein